MIVDVKDAGMILVDAKDFERMKNCTNCEHKEVCVAVARRKATKANDYSACSKWKLWDGDDS